MRARRVAGVVLIVLFGVVLGVGYRLLGSSGAGEAPPDVWLVPTLSLALVVLVLGLAGVLIRNLVRLIIERKRGVLGSRLRSKLVFFFLALVLVPAIVLFIGSAKVIQQTVEGLLRTPMEGLLEQSRDIVATWSDSLQQQCMLRAREVASAIEAAPPPADHDLGPHAARTLARWHGHESGMAVWLVGPQGPLVVSPVNGAALDVSTRGQLEEVIVLQSRLTRQRGQPTRGVDRLGKGLVAHAAIPLDERGERVVVVTSVVPAEIAEKWSAIDQANQRFRKFRFERRELVRFYLTLIGLIFVATLFVATWIGFYLARRITVPIQEVAGAAREISAGNLGVRVKTNIGDEMGTLVEAFNEMAAQLQENRAVISRSHDDLRQSNQALDERRRYIETLIAQLSTGVVSLDPQGRVTTANPAVEAILGVAPRRGDDWVELLQRHGLGPWVDRFVPATGAAASDGRLDLELSVDQRALLVAVSTSALVGAGGEHLGTLVMIEDLTELTRAQRALAWQEVARRLAHEIKNPLTPIQLAAQRLRKKFLEHATDLDEVLLEATSTVEQQVGALKRLVDEFSQFARMPEIDPRPVEIAPIVDSVISLYRGLPGVSWQLDLDRDAGPVSVDAEQLRRVLINLIDNAVAAMAGQGNITVVSRTDALRRLLRIEVADTGPGVAAGDRDRMFVPYFSTKQRGSGLGLAIVHRVVTDHHGTIRVEDNRPRGARFVLELPI